MSSAWIPLCFVFWLNEFASHISLVRLLWSLDLLDMLALAEPAVLLPL